MYIAKFCIGCINKTSKFAYVNNNIFGTTCWTKVALTNSVEEEDIHNLLAKEDLPTQNTQA